MTQFVAENACRPRPNGVADRQGPDTFVGSPQGRDMKTRLIALIAFTAVVAAACSTGLSEQRALTGAAPAGPGGTSVEIPNREDRPQQPGRPALGENARPYVETLELSIEDIQAFWTTKMPKVFGQEFEPIPNDKIFAYSQNNPPPACGTGQQPSADDLVGNAFYCSEGGFIAFDDENLFPKLYKNFGSYAVAMVLAHEWGHAVQDQMGISGGNVPTVYLEQQADCFAGAWTKWVDDGDSPNLSLSPGSLDAALGGMLEFRDEPGTNPNDPAAHGSGFDRVRAFGMGLPRACRPASTTRRPHQRCCNCRSPRRSTAPEGTWSFRNWSTRWCRTSTLG